jgi:phosphoglycerate dehydrogenase-like enzyme
MMAPVMMRAMLVMVPDVAGRAALDPLPAGFEVAAYAPGSVPELGAAELLVPDFLDHGRLAEALAGAGSLRILQTFSAGVDWLLPHVPPGVTVASASVVHAASVAEWVLAAILADLKELPRWVVAQRAHRWAAADDVDLANLQGATVLIAGHGAIGAAVEARLAPFGAEVVRVARRARPGTHATDQLGELLPAADVVVVLVPLTDATRGLFDASLLARMRDGALLVNAGRGPVVDQEALLAELRIGRLRAALDVADPEPLPAGDPLWDAPGLLITPHVAGSTRGYVRRGFAHLRAQLQRLADGEELAEVVRDGY